MSTGMLFFCGTESFPDAGHRLLSFVFNHILKIWRTSICQRTNLQRTLRLNSLNREQRKGYERGDTDYTNFRGYNCNEHSIFYFTSLPPKPLQSYKGHSL